MPTGQRLDEWPQSFAGNSYSPDEHPRYWKQGQSITRPVFFRLQNVVGSTLSGFTLKNSPFRTFSIVTSKQTTLSGLTLDSSAGNGLAKSTDGFDLTKNDHITITGNKIYNQDD
ncbi:Glycosyl hydrolases family 28 [Phytophthora infestans]|uniref:Glycosyl hydrolases family 28 n=1 Tax=Phytophthora infestans TaxID=4787 RepID=A0A833T8F1_PHYIN|nr:Glycosyl hydrolases family 28 [Phytophthora infestans]